MCKLIFCCSFINNDQNLEQSYPEWANVILVFKNTVKLKTKNRFNDRLKTKMTSWIDNLILRYFK